MAVRSSFSTGAAGAAAAALLLAPVGRAQAGGALDPYLPKSGTITGHVVTFAVAPEDQAISARFRHAVQDNMDWFKRAVTSNKPGAPLPYDKKMGITPAEYDRLQHLTPATREGEAVSVALSKDADGTLRLKPDGAAVAALAGVTFPPGEAMAVTPVGTLSIFNEIHQKDAAGPLGAWNGAEWAQVEPADSDKPAAKLAFGKRDVDGQGLLYYQVAPTQGQAERSLVVFYKLD